MRERDRQTEEKREGGKTASRGSREMNHIIMNNNMPCPWCVLSVWLLIVMTWRGILREIGGDCVSREARTATLRDSPRPNTHRFPQCARTRGGIRVCRDVPRFFRRSIRATT